MHERVYVYGWDRERERDNLALVKHGKFPMNEFRSSCGLRARPDRKVFRAPSVVALYKRQSAVDQACVCVCALG